MTDTSVDAQAPPRQDNVIASWGDLQLVDVGGGQAVVTLLSQGFRPEVARVAYGIIEAASPVEWNDTGKDAREQYKRDALDTKIYTEIARWLRSRS